MKILLIDRDQLSSQMISSRISGEDYIVEEETVKNNAMEKLSAEAFDVILVDPAPMKDAKAMVMNIRRASRSYPYVIVMGEGLNMDSVTQMGGNNFLNKPVDPSELNEKLDCAKELKEFNSLLGDSSEDFPSAGGVIAKSAFNQLFLSAIDRSWRYAESSYILSVKIKNYKEIKELDGEHHATYGISKLAHHLVHLRRQSDVIGQTAVNEYCLLLQRTGNENEALEAAKRFAATLDEINDFIPPEGNSLKIYISLMELPTGKYAYEETLLKEPPESI